MIPDNITKEHILSAIAEIKREGVPDSRKSYTHYLKYEGEEYPPKYVLSIANKFANGVELNPSEFSAGNQTNAFYNRIGLQVSKKGTKGQKKVNMKYWLYAPGQNADLWDEFYHEGVMGLGFDELGDLNEYSSKAEIVTKLQELEQTDGSKKNDATSNYEFKEGLSVGDIVIVKKGRRTLLGYGEVTSDYYYDSTKKTYQKRRDVKWIKKGVWKLDFDLVLKTLTDITEYKSDHPNFETFYERLMGAMNENKPDVKIPLNQILYGPPGTGKTYKLSKEYFPLFTSEKASVSKNDFVKALLVDKSWWEVIALAVLEIGKAKVADIHEHEYVKYKASISNSTTVTPTIWGQLQAHTVDACETVKVAKRSSPQFFNKTDDKHWEIIQTEIEQQAPELLAIHEKIKGFTEENDVVIKRYSFITFHQSYSYEDFIEGIKPVLDDTDNDVGYILEDGVFKKLCLKARKDISNQYAIFIDEINRGNVSQIFGELITLIEDDKREGMKNELSVTLPYSKKTFSVPPNVHIIGTMNTADRSVEALDTALRRRFSFHEMLPDPNELKVDFHGINLQNLLSVINDRIEVLVDRDHTIGHAFFMNVETLKDLQDVFSDKIIPLLQEYFYGDYSKIELVLGAGFFEPKKEVSSVAFAINADISFEGNVYHLKNVSHMSNVEFEEALKGIKF